MGRSLNASLGVHVFGAHQKHVCFLDHSVRASGGYRGWRRLLRFLQSGLRLLDHLGCGRGGGLWIGSRIGW